MKKCWLNNKTVIISGASGGIGFSVAERLIKQYNCKVIGIARNKQKMQNAINSLGTLSENFTDYYFDVSVEQNWVDFVNDLKAKNIVPDILINNAGFMLPFSRFDKYSGEEIEEIIKTNFIAYLYSVKNLLPLLKKSKTPAIANVSSAAGLCPVVGQSMYCATKYAVRGFTDTIRQDYKKKIYVAGIYPGFINTQILDRQKTTDKENKLIHKLMMPVNKASRKIVKGLKKHKKSISMGFDGKSMNFFGRLFPVFTANLISKILKKSKLELFSEVFGENK